MRARNASGNNANCYTDPYTFPIDSDKYTTVAGEFQKSSPSTARSFSFSAFS